MDLPISATAFSSRSSPASPFPPLALSDFLSQQPFSSYDEDDDRVDMSPVIQPAKDDGVSSRRSLSGKESPHPDPELLGAKSSTTLQEKAIESQPYDPLTVNWQSKRSQLPPSKNVGKKGDWIRSWSEAVGVHGASAYCACSEPCNTSTMRTQDRELKSRIRRIIQRKTSSKQLQEPETPSVEAEPRICHNCSRPSSPAVTLPPARDDNKMLEDKKKRKRDRFLAFFSSAQPPSHSAGPFPVPHPARGPVVPTETTDDTSSRRSSIGPRGDLTIKKMKELHRKWEKRGDAARATNQQN
ncbi:hypothetical protein V8F20_001941 [Naviculisporaceae sp. PSN 640]